MADAMIAQVPLLLWREFKNLSGRLEFRQYFLVGVARLLKGHDFIHFRRSGLKESAAAFPSDGTCGFNCAQGNGVYLAVIVRPERPDAPRRTTPVGMTSMPKKLARPVEDTLFFAGEATNSEGQQGTVQTALASGCEAVRRVQTAASK